MGEPCDRAETQRVNPPCHGSPLISQNEGVGGKIRGDPEFDASRIFRGLGGKCFDQPAAKTGFLGRRYAVKPRPAKLISVIAHVEGSGAEATAANAAKGFSDDPASVVDAEGISADGPRYPR
jgi:hypothetical protein